MAVVPVVVQEWQQACCGSPFSIATRVEWTLELHDPAEFSLPDQLSVELAGTAVADGEPFQGWFPTVVRAGELVAYWRAPARVEGDLRMRGVFYEDHHSDVPDDLQATPGTVRRIRVLWAPKELRDGVYRMKRGRLDLREVNSSEDDPYGGGARPAPDYTFDGWLVDLEVDTAATTSDGVKGT